MHFFIRMLPLILIIACKQDSTVSDGEENMTTPVVDIPNPDDKDYHTYANTDEVRLEHLQLTIKVDFDKKELEGVASWTFHNTGTSQITFDTRDLEILEVRYGLDEKPAKYTLGKNDKALGRPLHIEIDNKTEHVSIHYRTKPEAAALQWLTPEQAGSTLPFLYTQSQAILARSWVPCQDSPKVRFTYDAFVTVPSNMMALMSARNSAIESADGRYRFRMVRPIPSYLMALAVGDLEFRPYEKRAGIYAQPDMLISAAWEFEDTEAMMDIAESLYGPYQWERYDMLILPSSFPFGGMENPMLTFLTPTVVAGDRSLTTIVAHELAHSWSGNLVTNATWNDFWLNEGFTVYFERRIIEALYGVEFREMIASLGYQGMMSIMKQKGFNSPDTRLKLNLKGRNPDDGMSRIAYEKGYLFLRTLEKMYGREKIDQFLKDWFTRNAFKSVTTEKFLDHLKKSFPDGAQQLRPEEWIYGTSLPDNADIPVSSAFERVDQAIASFASHKDPIRIDTTEWKAQMWIHFLKNLPLTVDFEGFDKVFGLSTSKNMEYSAAFLERAIQAGKGMPFKEAIHNFLHATGRRKFLTPIYTSMLENGMETEAKKIYNSAKSGYHSVSTSAIDAIFDTHSM